MDAPKSLPDVQAIAAAIRAYIERHPQAMDTAEGIQRWWLLPQFGEVSLWVVEAALTLLEEEGEVRKFDAAWSQAAYQRARPPAAH